MALQFPLYISASCKISRWTCNFSHVYNAVPQDSFPNPLLFLILLNGVSEYLLSNLRYFLFFMENIKVFIVRNSLQEIFDPINEWPHNSTTYATQFCFGYHSYYHLVLFNSGTLTFSFSSKNLDATIAPLSLFMSRLEGIER